MSSGDKAPNENSVPDIETKEESEFQLEQNVSEEVIGQLLTKITNLVCSDEEKGSEPACEVEDVAATSEAVEMAPTMEVEPAVPVHVELPPASEAEEAFHALGDVPSVEDIPACEEVSASEDINVSEGVPVSEVVIVPPTSEEPILTPTSLVLEEDPPTKMVENDGAAPNQPASPKEAPIASQLAICDDLPGPSFAQSVRLSDVAGGEVPTDNIEFKLRKIKFDNCTRNIVTQNLNGPCPLIAIVNSLILKGRMDCFANRTTISRLDMIDTLMRHLVSATPKLATGYEEEAYQTLFNNVVDVLKRSGSGLDVNLHFNDTTNFEHTDQYHLFELLGVRLFHGWVLPAEFNELAPEIRDLSYDQLMDARVSDKEMSESLKVAIDYLDTECNAQMSPIGLSTLTGGDPLNGVPPNVPCVLFRNNHFHTIVLRSDSVNPQSQQLYALITDVGYLNEDSCVWECYSSYRSSYFVNSSFESAVYEEPPLATMNDVVPDIPDTSYDFALALQLEEEERASEEARRRRTQSDATARQAATQTPTRDQRQAESAQPRRGSHTPKSSSKCVIS